MKYFEQHFSDVDFTKGGQVKVTCPFHQDTHPSATVNVEESLFYCPVCKEGHNELQFTAKLNNISMTEAGKMLSILDQRPNTWEYDEKASLWANIAFLKQVRALGLSDETIDKLSLGLTKDDKKRPYLAIPVFWNKILVDVREYNLGKYADVPKMKGRQGVEIGYIVPYDVWLSDPSDITYIMEGEKDMMLARELGLNAITLTGGAGAKPNDYAKNALKGRNIVICYDNDTAGREGMTQLNDCLLGVANDVKYINIGDVVKHNKEDFSDYVMVYGGTLWDFLALPQYHFPKQKPIDNTTKVKDALVKNIVKKQIESVVTVTAEFADVYAVPTIVVAEKVESNSDNDKLFVGQKLSWFLESSNIQQLLPLIEVDAKKEQVLGHIKKYINVPSKETGINFTLSEYKTVYKYRVSDLSDTAYNEETANISVDIYTMQPMIMGSKYYIKYKLYPHPTKNQKLIAMATDVQEMNSVDSFNLDKALLEPFLIGKRTIVEHLDKLYQSSRHYIAKHLNFNLWLMNELVFNSILRINYNGVIRGALDVAIIGDTQVGKSETASKMTMLYDFGHFLSLKTSTTVGLIGGSNKVDGSFVNTIGAIPRQHQKLVVLEEFSGAKPDFIKTMTEVRSSGFLHFARAAGETRVPCLLRMVTVSNPVADDDGTPKAVTTFPNGIEIVSQLIKSAEDIARYDAFMLIEKPKKRYNPFEQQLIGQPIPKDCYIHKARYTYTRTPDNVKFDQGVEAYIWDKAEELNDLFECNFPVFGTTTNLKLARFSVALATLLMNVDTTFTNIIVTKEIVDYMVEFLKSNYDNSTFKLREYKLEFDSYAELGTMDVKKLQELYGKNAVVLQYLEGVSKVNRNSLRVVSGLENDPFGILFNTLVKSKFIKIIGDNVQPTVKFRQGMKKIDRSFAPVNTMIQS